MIGSRQTVNLNEGAGILRRSRWIPVATAPTPAAHRGASVEAPSQDGAGDALKHGGIRPQGELSRPPSEDVGAVAELKPARWPQSVVTKASQTSR